MSQEDYPYTADVGNCSTNTSKIKVKVVNATVLDTPNEDLLAAALVQYGPLAICKRSVFFLIKTTVYRASCYFTRFILSGILDNRVPFHVRHSTSS